VIAFCLAGAGCLNLTGLYIRGGPPHFGKIDLGEYINWD
jgi:hypothetical protein